MTTLENVQAALSAAKKPVTARELFEVNDHFESIDDLSKSLSKLVKTGRAKVCGMTSPPKGNARKLYQAVAEKNDDLDRQLAEAILERDRETAEAVIEPMIGAWPELPKGMPPGCEPLPTKRYSLRQLGIKPGTKHDGDPIVRAISRLPIGRIQGLSTDIERGRRLANMIGDAGPDVSAWLHEFMDKLENAA